MSSTVITAKYLKPAQFDSKLFKVCEYDEEHEKLQSFIKPYEGTDFLYLKEKYLAKSKTELAPHHYYKIKLTFDEFTNKKGEDIKYISKIRLKLLPDYVDPTGPNELSSESDSEF